MIRGILCVLALLVLSLPASATVIYVPDDYKSIQAAIGAAVNGDSVIVRPGTYYENIDFNGKDITVKSEKGPHVTVIDAGQAGSAVVFISGESSAASIEGFTLTNGSGTEHWGGRYCGGGVFCKYDSSPVISGNIVVHNRTDYDGAGIWCGKGSSPTIANNIIAFNECYDNGYASNGGGVCCTGVDCSALIVNNYIHHNACFNAGGGGGINCYLTANVRIINNTICHNFSDGHGGGIDLLSSATVEVVNTILYGNNAPNGSEISLRESSSALDVSYSSVRGGKAGVFIENTCTLDWGAGMIDACPLFVEGAVGDYHLTFHSPCRDAGDSTAAGLPAGDFEGDPRIAGSSVDMGADEFHPHLYHTGTFTSGGFVDFRIIGTPYDNPVALGLGSGIQDPPQVTPYGDLYLQLPLHGQWNFDFIPSSGVLVFPMALPAGLIPGDDYAFQALIGPLGDPNSTLTNPMVLMVE